MITAPFSQIRVGVGVEGVVSVNGVVVVVADVVRNGVAEDVELVVVLTAVLASTALRVARIHPSGIELSVETTRPPSTMHSASTPEMIKILPSSMIAVTGGLGCIVSITS